VASTSVSGALGLGDLIEQAIRETGIRVPYRLVAATESKQLRASTMALLAETGKLHMVGRHDELEEQLVRFMPGGVSPDRMDAAAHAVNELASGIGGGSSGEAWAPWSDAPARTADSVAAWEETSDWGSTHVGGDALERWARPGSWS
jgi:hypothetical protein